MIPNLPVAREVKATVEIFLLFKSDRTVMILGSTRRHFADDTANTA